MLGRSTAAAKVAITQGCVTRAAIPAPVILHEHTAYRIPQPHACEALFLNGMQMPNW